MALINKLSAIGDAVRERTGLTDELTLDRMATEIKNIPYPVVEEITITSNGTYSAPVGIDGYDEIIVNTPSIPEEAYEPISGSCDYAFANNRWFWFLDVMGDNIKFENITSASNMFESSDKLTELPLINIKSPSMNKMFASCRNLAEINIAYVGTPTSSTTNAFDSVFSGCYKLRRINGLSDWPAICKGNSIYGLYSTFANCYNLDELVDIPFIYSTYGGNYQFGSAFANCYRLKELIFKTPAEGESNTVPQKSMVLDLTTTGTWINSVTTYLAVPLEKEIKDDATYQAYKDDIDSWTKSWDYSRYNHTSAVNTINSLPDCSATGTSTIKFKGIAGALTDGGAINTLTEEEIAVATAKGWTVALA